MSALHLPHTQLRPLAIADLAGALQYSLPENAELDAAGILRCSADSRGVANRPGDHKVDVDVDRLISRDSQKSDTTSNTLIVTCAILIVVAIFFP